MLDMQNLFSDGQAITASAESTNFINLGEPATPPGSPAPLKRRVGAGADIPLTIMVDEDFAGLTSLTVNVEVSDDEAFTSPTVVGSSGAVLAADLVAGVALNPSVVPFGVDKKYMRLAYVVSGTATAGSITAGISTGTQTNVG